MTYDDAAEAVLQSIFVALRESTTYTNTCQALNKLGVNIEINFDVTATPSKSETPASANAKFLQDMHIAPDVVPVVAVPKAPEPPAMPTTFTGWLIQKIVNSLKRKGPTT